MGIGTILLIVILLVVFGGGGGYYGYHTYSGSPWHGGGFGLGGILIACLVVWVLVGLFRGN